MIYILIFELNANLGEPVDLACFVDWSARSSERSEPKYVEDNLDCLCDVTNSCDEQCCCDGECGSELITYWNEYNLCANDGLAIPFCTSFYNQPMHVHDLYQGLRLIYTVIFIILRSLSGCSAYQRLIS
jgi:hypothetical protein